jgi:hypothetical protein
VPAAAIDRELRLLMANLYDQSINDAQLPSVPEW